MGLKHRSTFDFILDAVSALFLSHCNCLSCSFGHFYVFNSTKGSHGYLQYMLLKDIDIISIYMLWVCAFFIFNSIRVVPEVAQTEVDTCLLNHLWVNADSEGKQQKPAPPGDLRAPGNYNQQHYKPWSRQGRAVDFSGVQPARLLSSCICLRRPPLCALTGPQKAFQLLISCIYD